jgi:hypothetical protein
MELGVEREESYYRWANESDGRATTYRTANFEATHALWLLEGEAGGLDWGAKRSTSTRVRYRIIKKYIEAKDNASVRSYQEIGSYCTYYLHYGAAYSRTIQILFDTLEIDLLHMPCVPRCFGKVHEDLVRNTLRAFNVCRITLFALEGSVVVDRHAQTSTRCISEAQPVQRVCVAGHLRRTTGYHHAVWSLQPKVQSGWNA